MKQPLLQLTKNTLRLPFLCIMLFISACQSNDRKAKLEHNITIHIKDSQKIFSPDELLHLRNNNFSDYSKTFKDSSIFIMGNIQRVDEEGEILLKNSCEDCNLVCLAKDSTILPLLQKSDKVLFKGICKIVTGHKLVLITDCQLAQFSH